MFESTNLDLFPYPFHNIMEGSNYRYSNDLKKLEPHKQNFVVITPEYEKQIKRKREMLNKQPEVRFQSYPHTMEMQWELAEMLIDLAVEAHPEHFKVEKNGNQWVFHNLILNETESFILGDASSIELEPLDLIGRHFATDFVMMVHRDDNLYLEVAQESYAALFSPHWNKGMTFNEIHAPVPFVSRTGESLADRVRNFLIRNVLPGEPWTRINWNLMANRWDVNYETMDTWGPTRVLVTPENAGELVRLRVEEQFFYRLPRTDAVVFVLNTQFLAMKDLALRPEWLKQTYSILSDIPKEMAEYKGFAPFIEPTVEYLKNLVEKVESQTN
ncbi:MAG: heme-dependent oxidative N-demethylase family protein [Clostridia bacterium]